MGALPLHLYVHWPWCKAKCPYCDFNSHALPPEGLSPTVRARYIRQVVEEITWWQTQIAPERPLLSVFFGGGTPSLLQPTEIAEILNAAKRLGKISSATEVTLECNPTSLQEDYGQAYFQELSLAGVNRVSIGVQGLRDDWLGFLGRSHSAAGALATLKAARGVFPRVNADVIYGLPGQQLADWQALLQTLAKLNLSHVSAYQLTIERNTAFWGQVKRGAFQPVSGDTEATFFETTQQVLKAAGYENYEISNFAKPGQACRHNLGVWRSEDYIGVGAGAHGRVTLRDGTRVATATRKVPEAYVGQKPSGLTRFATYEPLFGARAIQEALFAGLRLSEGVDIGELRKKHTNADWKNAVEMAYFLDFCQMGWLEVLTPPPTTRWRLTRAGWPRLDALLRRMLPTLPEGDPLTRVRIQSDDPCAE
jgi:putative oxygen-independent coproporphyrinogen III oxidase